MKQFSLILAVLTVAVPGLGKTHKGVFAVPCTTLWPAVKDTLRNSGKYGIIGIDSTEMTAFYTTGAFKRVNSLVLNPKGRGSCEMQVQTYYSGLAHNDAGDLKKRVQESLDKSITHPVATP